jgi:hypothetical protein
MQLTNVQIARFQELFKSKFETEISKAEALEQGIKLVRLMELIYKPMTTQDLQKVLERQE